MNHNFGITWSGLKYPSVRTANSFKTKKLWMTAIGWTYSRSVCSYLEFIAYCWRNDWKKKSAFPIHRYGLDLSVVQKYFYSTQQPLDPAVCFHYLFDFFFCLFVCFPAETKQNFKRKKMLYTVWGFFSFIE